MKSGDANADSFDASTEFVPSSTVYTGRKMERAIKYKGRKGQQDERKVRKEELTSSKKANELETRAVFA